MAEIYHPFSSSNTTQIRFLKPTTHQSKLRTIQKFLIHCVLVAGKTAPFARQKSNMIVNLCPPSSLPLDYLGGMPSPILEKLLRLVKTGNYRKTMSFFSALKNAKLDLLTCTPDELDDIPGIGPKTARYFIMYTRNEEASEGMAVIDTHVLKWLRTNEFAKQRLEELGIKKLPKSTPQSKKLYHALESIVAAHAKLNGVSCRKWDMGNWDDKSCNIDEARAEALLYSNVNNENGMMPDLTRKYYVNSNSTEANNET
jgi:endonuclease III